MMWNQSKSVCHPEQLFAFWGFDPQSTRIVRKSSTWVYLKRQIQRLVFCNH